MYASDKENPCCWCERSPWEEEEEAGGDTRPRATGNGQEVAVLPAGPHVRVALVTLPLPVQQDNVQEMRLF